MRKEVVLWSCAALLILGSMSRAQDERPYLGLSMDSAPLPALLTKHLRLDAGQGIRVNNIVSGSPADKAGLERDDLIVALQGQKATDLEQLTEAVHKAGVGTEISLDMIHLGQPKTVRLKTEPVRAEVQWKYTAEAEVALSWRPGKLFKSGPNGQGWIEMSFDNIPDVNVDVKKFFKEIHAYHHVTDGEQYTITIEGDPADKDSRIVVHAGAKEYGTPVDKIDALPEKYREPAREALDNARKSSKEQDSIGSKIRLPELPGPDVYLKYFNDAVPRPDLDRLSQQKDMALEKLEGQIERLQQQMRAMEERNREMLDRLLEKKETKKNKNPDPEKATPSESKPSI
jgi:hypothetical protein